MSAEIKVRIYISVDNGFLHWTSNPGQIDIDQTEASRGGHCQIIGTSAEMIQFGDVVALGVAIFRNLDTTNYLDIGPYDTGSAGTLIPCIRLKPGEEWVIRITPATTWGAIANTAACKLDVNVFGA